MMSSQCPTKRWMNGEVCRLNTGPAALARNVMNTQYPCVETFNAQVGPSTLYSYILEIWKGLRVFALSQKSREDFTRSWTPRHPPSVEDQRKQQESLFNEWGLSLEHNVSVLTGDRSISRGDSLLTWLQSQQRQSGVLVLTLTHVIPNKNRIAKSFGFAPIFHEQKSTS